MVADKAYLNLRYAESYQRINVVEHSLQGNYTSKASVSMITGGLRSTSL